MSFIVSKQLFIIALSVRNNQKNYFIKKEQQMKAIHPYLNFPGNTEEAFNFYKKVFGGDFPGGIFRFDGTPGSENLSAKAKRRRQTKNNAHVFADGTNEYDNGN